MDGAGELPRQEGVVAEWNPRGFGFIHFTDGRRAYVHNSACGGAHLEVGETVSAVPAADLANPGKWAAHDVHRLSATATNFLPPQSEQSDLSAAVAAAQQVVESIDFPQLQQLEAELDPSRLLGVVTEWNPRGFGFIQFTDGRRAYVHNSQCGGEHLAEGETVSAVCVEDAQNPGKWAAVAVQRDLEGEDGVVTEWKEEGGFGFLTMNDGRRAYVHRSAFGGKGSLYVGMKLKVTTKPDPRNAGKWSVGMVLKTVDDSTPIAAAAAAAAAAVSAPIQPVAVAAQAAAGAAQAGADVVRACTVTEWDPRGYGFVKTDDNRRAYVHNSSCGGEHLQVGELISAHIVPDPQNPGKWAALNVQRGTIMVGEEGLVTGEQGTVTEWNDTGGYGFLSMDDGRRAYIHRNSFGGKGALTIGSKLMVTTKPDPRNPGKWSVDVVKGEVAVGLEQVAAAEQALLGALGGVLDSGGGLEAAAAATSLQPPAGEGGTVTDWHESGGYGFLAMDDGRRAYIHRNTFGGKGGLAVGTRLEVTTKPDPRNPGKWCVGQVLGGLSGEQMTATPAIVSVQEAVLQQPQVEEGTVSEWKEEGGYGFLSMVDGRRAYIHRSSFGGVGSLTIGMVLQVTIKPDPRNPGKWCVGEVLSVLSTSTGAPAEEPAAKRARV